MRGSDSPAYLAKQIAKSYALNSIAQNSKSRIPLTLSWWIKILS